MVDTELEKKVHELILQLGGPKKWHDVCIARKVENPHGDAPLFEDDPVVMELVREKYVARASERTGKEGHRYVNVQLTEKGRTTYEQLKQYDQTP
jgi:hypothetical protein